MHHERARNKAVPTAHERWLVEAGARIAATRTSSEAIDAFRAALVPRIADRCHITAAALAVSSGATVRHEQFMVPLATHGRVLALATLERTAGRPFTLRERTLAQDLATRAAQTLAEIRMREAEARAEAATAGTERLYVVAAAMSGALTVGDVARAALEATTTVFGAYGGCIWVVDPIDGRVALADARGYSDDLLARAAAFPSDEPSPVREAIATRKPSFYASRELIAERFPVAAEALYRSADVAYATIPLVVNDRAVGAISLAFAAERGLPTHDRAFVEAVGQQCGVALSRAQLFTAEQEARATAERAVAAREDFLTIASHEFRTPLTTLSLHLDALLRDPTVARTGSPAIDTRLPAMRRQVDRLTRLVDTMLEMSRASVPRDGLSLELVDLAALARDVASSLASDAAAARSPIDVQATGPVVGSWDRVRVEQVLTNLLGNAIKFGAGAPVTVTVSSGGDGNATLIVRDHGIGIARDAQHRVFERFERAVSSRHYSGLGLGLWIVKAIVEALDGNISVESAEASGTTFTVRLPASPLRPSSN